MKKILVVDDNPDILEVIKLVLELDEYEVLGISDGYELDNSIAKFNPDLILLDVMLGDLDGRELCNHLKTDLSTKDIAVIMISASHNMRSMLAKQCKPDDYIAKPFDIDNLLRKVDYQLSIH